MAFHRVALILPAVLALLSACGESPAPEPEARPVRTVVIESRVAGETVALVGTVQAETEVNQSFRIAGRMIERLVRVGDVVRRGQLLARLDSYDEETTLQSARAQLAAARAQLVEAANQFERMKDLVAENAVSRSQFDQAEANHAAAISWVESAQAQVVLAENRLSYTRLQATVDGVVTMEGAEAGEVVAAGTMVVQIAREGAWDAVFDVPAAIRNSAPPAAPITIALTANPEVTAAGRVREVSPRADPITGTFRVRVAIDKPPPAMRLGSTVTGRMRLLEVAGIQIPATAVVRSAGQPAVWVVDPATGTVAARAVTIESSSPDQVAIGSGLNSGDIVVTAGVHALRPGQKVRIPGPGL